MAGVTAAGLKEPDLVWAGAGQAGSTSTAYIRGADGGGGAGGDAAASLEMRFTARHSRDQVDVCCEGRCSIKLSLVSLL